MRNRQDGLEQVFKPLVLGRRVRVALHSASFLCLAQRAFAASDADLLRSSGVIRSARVLPPILPPLLPIAAMTREISDRLISDIDFLGVRERFGMSKIMAEIRPV